MRVPEALRLVAYDGTFMTQTGSQPLTAVRQPIEELAELAAAVGVTRQTIISIENERYTASLVLAYKLARFFGASIEEVFDFSDVEV